MKVWVLLATYSDSVVPYTVPYGVFRKQKYLRAALHAWADAQSGVILTMYDSHALVSRGPSNLTQPYAFHWYRCETDQLVQKDE
jgi:hypothetical protein